MLGHISLGVRDLAKAAAFYDAILATLGYARTDSSARSVGYGLPGASTDQFRLIESVDAKPPGAGFHLAFAAPSENAVDRFHETALRHGGADNGGPGLRPRYGTHYYAAFVIDQDGYRLEAKHPPEV